MVRAAPAPITTTSPSPLRFAYAVPANATQAKEGLPLAAISGSLRRRRHTSELNDESYCQGE